MRDHIEESRLLSEGAELCQRVYGENSGAFARMVRARLALGASTYGDTDYMQKDNLDEAIQEGLDGAAYPILDYQRVRSRLAPNDRWELRQYTLGVIAAAINLDTAIRRLQQARNEMLE